jgi:hypothetical protein
MTLGGYGHSEDDLVKVDGNIRTPTMQSATAIVSKAWTSSIFHVDRK